jgi:DUF971 family protein
MPTSPRPSGITLQRSARVLIIDWNDGHVSRYHFDGLRAVCPCVECRGGHANMGGPVDFGPLLAPDAGQQTLEDVQIVGNYALQPLWAGGHSTGIYTWAYLRGLCPCDECTRGG